MGEKYTISSIRKKVREFGKKVNAPKKFLTIRSATDGLGTPHIEINGRGFHYVVSERGTEFRRDTTSDIHTLLYWIFKGIVFQMASEYELKHRKSEEDFRRLLFSKTLDLFKKLDNQWYEWEKKNIENILKETPYEP